MTDVINSSQIQAREKTKIGIILNNIGTPQSYSEKDVGRYLKEFLMDKEIINAPWLIRFFLVYGLIVPRRKKFSAAKYSKIWGRRKSPLLEISESLQNNLLKEMNSSQDQAQYVIELGMRYGEPSTEVALHKLLQQGCEQIIFLPLYPQYARATVASAVELFEKLCHKHHVQNFKTIKPFYRETEFIDLMAEKLKSYIDRGHFEHIIFSFHGLPESQIKKNSFCEINQNCCAQESSLQKGCYRAQSFKTAELIAAKCGLHEKHYSVSFQSRLGPTKWLGPSTEETVKSLLANGVKKVLVQAPSFVTDCLETLEEINYELKEEFLAQGGLEFTLVEAPNDDERFVKFVKEIITQSL